MHFREYLFLERLQTNSEEGDEKILTNYFMDVI